MPGMIVVTRLPVSAIALCGRLRRPGRLGQSRARPVAPAIPMRSGRPGQPAATAAPIEGQTERNQRDDQ